MRSIQKFSYIKVAFTHLISRYVCLAHLTKMWIEKTFIFPNIMHLSLNMKLAMNSNRFKISGCMRMGVLLQFNSLWSQSNVSREKAKPYRYCCRGEVSERIIEKWFGDSKQTTTTQNNNNNLKKSESTRK